MMAVTSFTVANVVWSTSRMNGIRTNNFSDGEGGTNQITSPDHKIRVRGSLTKKQKKHKRNLEY